MCRSDGGVLVSGRGAVVGLKRRYAFTGAS
jgi:hypothetical protein